jgi:hypothetical protein
MKNKEMLYISSITVNIWTLYRSTKYSLPSAVTGMVVPPRGFTTSNLPCHHSCFIHAHAVPNGWRWVDLPSYLLRLMFYLILMQKKMLKVRRPSGLLARHSFETVWGYGPAIALRSSWLWARRRPETLWTMSQNSHSSL